MEGLSPKTALETKGINIYPRHTPAKERFSVPLGCNPALGAPTLINTVTIFPKYLGPLGRQYYERKKGAWAWIPTSRVWSTAPHWPHRQSYTFCSRTLGRNAARTRNSCFGSLAPVSTTFLWLSTTFLCFPTVCPRNKTLFRPTLHSTLYTWIWPSTDHPAEQAASLSESYEDPLSS